MSIEEAGELARLMPVANQPELKLTSATLACLMSVREFADSMLSSLGAHIGKRSTVKCYLEPAFTIGREKSKDRPDGLIVVRNGARVWSALVEAKVKNNSLDPSQVERYLDLARALKIDAVITISNQFAVDSSHSPVSVSKIKTRYVSLHHWSWSCLQTEAKIQLETNIVDDVDQIYILDEYLRFLSHPSSGVLKFSSMSPQWTEAYQHIQRVGSLTKNSPLTLPVISDWNELSRSFCLTLGEIINSNVSMAFTRGERQNPAKKIDNDTAMLVSENRLETTIKVENAASNIVVSADVATRHLVVAMTLQAPGDKKMSKSSINWILRQVQSVDASDIELCVNWPGRAQATCMSVPKALVDPVLLYETRQGLLPASFVVRLNIDLAGKFTQRKNFPTEVTNAVARFYDQAGQKLVAWHAKPPQVKKTTIVEVSKAIQGEVVVSDLLDQ